jgi:hypothetical protein
MSSPTRRRERGGNHVLVEGDAADPENFSSSKVIDKSGWGVESITHKDALPIFGRELEPL